MPQTDFHSIELSSSTASTADKASRFILIIQALWIIIISVFAQVGGWLVEQIFIISGFTWPKWGWAIILFGQSFLLLGPLIPLAQFWKNRQYRPIFQTWALAATASLFLLPIRFLSLPAAQRPVMLQIPLTLAYGGFVLIIIWLRKRRQTQVQQIARPQITIRGFLLALMLTPLLIYPWLARGALGSPLDAALNLVAGLLFGLVASLILVYFLLLPTGSGPAESQPTLLSTGFIAGVTLLLLSNSLSINGMQFLLMLSLPSLGWLLVSLSQRSQSDSLETNWPVLALLMGLTAAAPMMWIDPDELFLILNLSGGEVLGIALSAAIAVMLTGWILGLLLSLTHQRPMWQSRPLLLAGATGLWLLGGLIYSLAGQPGFYGDHLFVILKDQADLSAAVTIDNIDERRQFVYQTLVSHADETQANLRQALDRRNVRYQPYYLVNALDVTGGPLLRRWLAAQPDVDRVLYNPILRPLPNPISTDTGEADAPIEPGWNLTMIGADRVWREFGITGEGVVIGQSDSGVEWQHPELQPSYRGREGQHDYNWLDPWNATLEPTDAGGHGTHTLGSIVGQTTGVAPGATWYGCANLYRNLGNPALYLDCMQFMLAPYPLGGHPFTDGDPALGADILNNSWGCPDLEGCDPDTLLTGARALRQAGIFVVASAGNDGPRCETVKDPLALYDEVFSVGAIDEAGQLAFFSSRGPVTIDGSGRTKPDIVAPGVQVLSAYPGQTYEYADGTSMAGPHVAGVVALVWSANPDLIGQIETTEAILKQTAKPLPDPDQITDQPLSGQFPLSACGATANSVGQGIVDAYAAVQMAMNHKNQSSK